MAFMEAPKVSVALAQPDPSRFRSDERKFKLMHSSATSLFAMAPEGAPTRKTFDMETALSGTQSLFRLKRAELPELGKAENYLAPGGKRVNVFPDDPLKKPWSFAGGKDGDRRGSQVTDRVGSRTSERRGTRDSEDAAVDDALEKAAREALKKLRTGGFLSHADKDVLKQYRGEPKSHKYYRALMKVDRKRNEQAQQFKYDEYTSKAEKAAERAYKAMVAAEKQEEGSQAEGSSRSNADSAVDFDDSDEEDEEDESDGEELPLVPYDGIMKIEIEISVQRAPGQDFAEELPDPTQGSARGSADASTAASSSSESTPRLDLADELLALQEELGVEEDKESEVSEGLPDGLSLASNMDNLYSLNDPRLAIGIAGTVYFVPEVERYSFQPSLPPPPPLSLLGRRKIRLKPRLPLDISNHRYEDEYPNVFATSVEKPPTLEDRRRLEVTMCTHDFYVSATKSMTKLPKLKTAKEFKELKKKFGAMIEEDIKKSVAWKNRFRREYYERKKAEKEAEEAAAQAKVEAEEAEKNAAAAAAAARAAADVDSEDED